jgi:hypothetical protein
MFQYTIALNLSLCTANNFGTLVAESAGTKFHMEFAQYNLQFVTTLSEVRSDDFTSMIIHTKAIENNKD